MSRVDAFWRAYVTSLPENLRPSVNEYEIIDFGDSKELADELGRLVQTGIKTATSMLLWELEQGHEKFPFVGEIDIVTDGSGEPLSIIELIEVEERSFNTIDEAFAYDYGEGDRTLGWWRRAMWAYYERECQRWGREPNEAMPLICMRFRLLYRAE
jgi:uncharacterized protein YhfF